MSNLNLLKNKNDQFNKLSRQTTPQSMYQLQSFSIEKLHFTNHSSWYGYDVAIKHLKISNIMRYQNTDELNWFPEKHNKSGQIRRNQKI